MLATTQPEDIPQTIRSRCQHFSFRAVKFEQIVEQLRDLCGRESIQADEDALALLAEAGDGSMRDALSILDQAIASSHGNLSAEAVRQLIGVAPSGILEEIMQAAARSSSEEILQTVDRLLAEDDSRYAVYDDVRQARLALTGPLQQEDATAEALAFLRTATKKLAEPSLRVGLLPRSQRFDIIFFDPPYATDYESLLNYLGKSFMSAEQCVRGLEWRLVWPQELSVAVDLR